MQRMGSSRTRRTAQWLGIVRIPTQRCSTTCIDADQCTRSRDFALSRGRDLDPGTAALGGRTMEPLIAWLQQAGAKFGNLEITPHTDLIDQGVLDSLELLRLVA